MTVALAFYRCDAMAHALKTYRAAHDKTLADLAAEIGSTAATLSNIETGKIHPSAGLALKIKEATGVPLHELRPDLWDRPTKQG